MFVAMGPKLYAPGMPDSGGAPVWPARLRWRLRGALQWPLFAVLTVLDGALLAGVLPISGTGTSLPGGLLLAMFFNLVAVAALGRLGGRWLRRRRPDMPKVVAEDQAGSTLLLGVTAALVIGGLVHAPQRDAAERALRDQAEAARAYVLAHGAAAHRRHLDQLDTEQHADDFFRTCVPGDVAAHVLPLCLLIDTSHDPPVVREDADRSPNRHL
jgi:hypothetical protein